MKFVIITFILTFPAILAAQQVRIIPKVGVSLANIRTDPGWQEFNPEVYNVSSAGFAGGVGLEIGLSKGNMLALQPELWFLQKGFYKKDQTDRYALGYLELPLLLKGTVKMGRIQAFLNAGPSVSMGTGGYSQDPYNNREYRRIAFRSPEGDEGRVTGWFDGSVHLGGGVGYQAGKLLLLAEARYGMGLRKLTIYDPVLYNGMDFYNRYLFLNVGLSLPLGKTSGQ